MSERGAAGWATAESQLDLFDEYSPIDAGSVGFEMRVPLMERPLVLISLARLEDTPAHSTLMGLHCPGAFPHRFCRWPYARRRKRPCHCRPDSSDKLLRTRTRQCGLRRICWCQGCLVPVEPIHDGLSDPSAPVGRLAATALGIAGGAAAVAPLWPSPRASRRRR